MEIITKNNTEKELNAKKVLEKLIQKYNPPILTDKVLIDSGSVSHSHPILTLNTRDIEERVYLEMFVHEQLHWFAQNQPMYKECITFLKKKYKDNGECNTSGRYPNSFWEHIIVNFNTRNILNQLLSSDDINYIYSGWQAYPKTEKLVADNFEKIKKQLESFRMIYLYKYIYSFSTLFYNNTEQYYDLPVFESSSIKKAVIFCGNYNQHFGKDANGNVCIYLESLTRITSTSPYIDSKVYFDLIYLSIKEFSDFTLINVPLEFNFDDVIKRFSSNRFSNKNMRYNGFSEYDSLSKVYKYIGIYNSVDEFYKNKFLTTLFVFGLTLEIESLSNTHFKTSLLLTMYVSIINQLAENPTPKCGGEMICRKCGETTYHRGNGEINEIRNLITNNVPKDQNPNYWVSFILRMYRKPRSGFLHTGVLSGNELNGGFFLSNDNSIIENVVNIRGFAISLFNNYFSNIYRKIISNI